MGKEHFKPEVEFPFYIVEYVREMKITYDIYFKEYYNNEDDKLQYYNILTIEKAREFYYMLNSAFRMGYNRCEKKIEMFLPMWSGKKI